MEKEEFIVYEYCDLLNSENIKKSVNQKSSEINQETNLNANANF